MQKKVPDSAFRHNVDFNKNIRPTEVFSDRDFFKTVHLGGDDVIAELEEAKKREHQVWKEKLVVDNPVFKVRMKSNQRLHPE